MWAAEKGCSAAVRLLTGGGADAGRQGSGGETAALLAARIGHAEAVPALARAGADLSAADSKGRTPLMVAVAANNCSTVQALVRAGAPLQSLPPQYLRSAAYLLSQRCTVGGRPAAPRMRSACSARWGRVPVPLRGSQAHPCWCPLPSCRPWRAGRWAPRPCSDAM